MEKQLVYIVDDDPDDRQLILDAFLQFDTPVDYAFIDHATQLLEMLEEEENGMPDLILLDLNMPGVMGLQALRTIRANKKLDHVPVVILTTSALSMDKKLSYEYRANCFLRKPDTFQELTGFAGAILTLWLK